MPEKFKTSIKFNFPTEFVKMSKLFNLFPHSNSTSQKTNPQASSIKASVDRFSTCSRAFSSIFFDRFTLQQNMTGQICRNVNFIPLNYTRLISSVKVSIGGFQTVKSLSEVISPVSVHALNFFGGDLARNARRNDYS